jgi:serine/threonine protein kinase
VLRAGALLLCVSSGILEVFSAQAPYASVVTLPFSRLRRGTSKLRTRTDRSKSDSFKAPAGVFSACVLRDEDQVSVALAFEGTAFVVPLPSSAKRDIYSIEASPSGASLLGSCTCVGGMGSIVYTGHSNGAFHAWKVKNGEHVRAFAGHQGSVMAIALSAERVYSVGDDGWVRQWQLESSTETRKWKVPKEVLFSEMRIIDNSLLVLAGVLTLHVIDLVSSEPEVVCLISRPSQILSWGVDGGWIHMVCENGEISSFRMPQPNSWSTYLPRIIVAPDSIMYAASTLRCACALFVPTAKRFLVGWVDAKVTHHNLFVRLETPSYLSYVPAPPCIVRLQARIRMRLVLRKLALTSFSNVERARKMRAAVRDFALFQCFQAERGITLRLAGVREFVEAGMSWASLDALTELMNVHGELARRLAEATQVWPPPNLEIFAGHIQRFLDAMPKASQALMALSNVTVTLGKGLSNSGVTVPLLPRLRGLSLLSLIFSFFFYFERALVHVQNFCLCSGSPATIVEQYGRLHRLAVVVSQDMAEKVRRAMFRDSYLCDKPDWESKTRSVLLECEGAWQEMPGYRVAICSDALLVITPNNAKDAGTLRPGRRQPPSTLVEVIPLSQIVNLVAVDTGSSQPNVVFATRGGDKFSFLPERLMWDSRRGEVSFKTLLQYWLYVLRRATDFAEKGKLGMDLGVLLRTEDTNIPVVVASVMRALQTLEASFSELWLEQRFNGDECMGEDAALSVWRGKDSPIPPRALFAALHVWFRRLPAPVISYVAATKLAQAGNDVEAMEAAIALLPQHSQLLLGFFFAFLGDTFRRAADPAMEQRLFALVFAHELMPMGSFSWCDWLTKPDFETEVKALQCLLQESWNIWRGSGAKPERLVDIALANENHRWAIKRQLSRVSLTDVQHPLSASGTLSRSGVSWNSAAFRRAQHQASQDASAKLSFQDRARRSKRHSSTSVNWDDELPPAPPRVGSNKLSGLFSMESSREPSLDHDYEDITVRYGDVEKRFPFVRNTTVADLLNSFVQHLKEKKAIAQNVDSRVLGLAVDGTLLALRGSHIAEPGAKLLVVVNTTDVPLASASVGVSAAKSSSPVTEPSSGSGPAVSVGSGPSPGSDTSPVDPSLLPCGGDGSDTSTTPSPPTSMSSSASGPVPLVRRGSFRNKRPEIRQNRSNANVRVRRSLSTDEIFASNSHIVPKVMQSSKPELDLAVGSPQINRSVVVTEASAGGDAQQQQQQQQQQAPPPLLPSASQSTPIKTLQHPQGVKSPTVSGFLERAEKGSSSPVLSPISATSPPLGTSGSPVPALNMAGKKPSLQPAQTSPRFATFSRLKIKRRDTSAAARPQNDIVQWNYVKLVVVGQENVGKTHLCRALENSKYEMNMSTDGIEVGQWSTGKGKGQITFVTFDFGGQEIFYPTHQFFLTSRCVYLVVFRLDRKDYLERVMYWLRTIDATVSGTPAPPVVLVGTHRDQETVTDASMATYRAALEDVARRFKMIQDIHFLSCTKGTGIAQLRAAVADIAFRKKLAGELVPSYYVDLWDAVIAWARACPFVSYEEFKSMSQECGVPEEALPTVLKFLHDSGRIITFQKADASRGVVLDPAWLAGRMSDLISFKQNWPNGLVDLAQLRVIWKSIEESRQEEILSILEQFQVLFVKRAHGTKQQGPIKKVIVPCLLPERVDLGNTVMSLKPNPNTFLCKRTYKFKFIPAGFVARLITRCHAYKEEFKVAKLWRSGLVAVSPGGFDRALVECVANYKENVFTLTITGTNSSEKRDRPSDDSSWDSTGADLRSVFGVRPLANSKSSIDSDAGYNNNNNNNNNADNNNLDDVIGDRPFSTGEGSSGNIGSLIDSNPTSAKDDSSVVAVLSMSSTSTGTSPVGSLRSTSTRPSFKALLHVVSSIIDTLISDFYVGYQALVERVVYCPVCVGRAAEDPGAFSYEALVNACVDGTEAVACPKCKENVLISSVAPDIAFIHLPVIADVEVGELIGRGGFAVVYKGKLADGTEVAIKELLQASPDEALDRFRQFQHEVFVMSRINFPNLIKFFGVMVKPRPRIIMEFCPMSDLSVLLYSTNPDKMILSFPQKLAVALQVACSLAYLHGQSPPIVHRDVRSPNVLLASINPVVAKLSDYGLATMVDSKLSEGLLSFQWLPPEVLSGAQYDESVDVYSLAMLMIELMANRLPFVEKKQFFHMFTTWTSYYCRLCGENNVCRQEEACLSNQVEKNETGEKLVWKEQLIKDAIVNGLRPDIPNYLPPRLVQLIESSWVKNPLLRPSAYNVAKSLLALLRDEKDAGASEMLRASQDLIHDVEVVATRNRSSELLAPKHRFVMADPVLYERFSANVSCVVRVDQGVWVGFTNGEIATLSGWRPTEDSGSSSGAGSGSASTVSSGPSSLSTTPAASMLTLRALGGSGSGGLTSPAAQSPSGSPANIVPAIPGRKNNILSAHAERVVDMVYLPALELVVSAGQDGVVNTWDCSKQKKVKRRFTVKQVSRYFLAVVFGFRSILFYFPLLSQTGFGNSMVTCMVEVRGGVFVVMCYDSGAVCLWEFSEKDATLANTCTTIRTGITCCCVIRSFESTLFIASGGKMFLLKVTDALAEGSWSWFKMITVSENRISAMCNVGDKQVWVSQGSTLHCFDAFRYDLTQTVQLNHVSPITSLLCVTFNEMLHVWCASSDLLVVVDGLRKEEMFHMRMPCYISGAEDDGREVLAGRDEHGDVCLVHMAHNLVVASDTQKVYGLRFA